MIANPANIVCAMHPPVEICPRASVLMFAETMEQKLLWNDHKGGWASMDIHWLLGKLKEEVHELEGAIYQLGPTEIRYECADVGNIAMMIHDKMKG
jgi:hypothetical protein